MVNEPRSRKDRHLWMETQGNAAVAVFSRLSEDQEKSLLKFDTHVQSSVKGGVSETCS